MTALRDITTTREQSIYRGTEFSRHEIEIAGNQLTDLTRVLNAAIKTLNDGFTMQKMVEIKLAAETVTEAAAHVERTAAQVRALAHSLSSTFQQHINRRPRP